MFLLSRSAFFWGAIPSKTTFSQIQLSETFTSMLKFSFIFSIVLNLPTFSYQIYLFCLPAMFYVESQLFKRGLVSFNAVILLSIPLTYFIIFPFYVYSSLEVTKLMLPLSNDSLIPFQISLRIDDLIMQFLYCFIVTIFTTTSFFIYFINITDKLFALSMINKISLYTRLTFFWAAVIITFSVDMFIIGLLSYIATAMFLESNIVVKIML